MAEYQRILAFIETHKAPSIALQNLYSPVQIWVSPPKRALQLKRCGAFLFFAVLENVHISFSLSSVSSFRILLEDIINYLIITSLRREK